MALPINIDEVLLGRSVEWERLEFKENWNPEAVMHTLCAFANDFHNLGGGYLFIGIADDNGRPVLPPSGLSPDGLDRLQKEVLRIGYKIVPAYHPLIDPCTIQDRHVLVLRAPGGQSRPYKAPDSLSKDSKVHSCYIRRGSSTVKATTEEEIELYALAAQTPFDDRMNSRSTVLDLRLPLVKAFLTDIGSALADQADSMTFDGLCRRMGIIDGPTEYTTPRNVGLMFFHEEPERFFPQTQIDIVQFPDGPSGSRIVERTFKGPLSQMLSDALLFISNSILEETVDKHPDRAKADRFFNYPYAAVEELLVNAVFHRSYEIREPIEVRVLPECITITSYPGPDRSISLRDLDRGQLVARRYRNRRIGEFLKDLRLTEGRGTGIPTTLRAMRENGSPAPSFNSDEGRTYFTATLPIHPSSIPTVTPTVTPQATPTVTRLVGDKMLILLAYCVSPRDRVSIQARLGLKDKNNVLRRYLNPAIAAGWLAVTDPLHPNSPSQKYRTTSKGLAFLNTNEQKEDEKAQAELVFLNPPFNPFR